jgi:alkanesulfonate monooxygenase SsuD/methylene tetrahydromethanopterin reductase-like flavin-dependent oxidoreductase (luciferase family)
MHTRPPTLVANFFATLDHLSEGRVDLGLGAGTGPFHDQAVAFGAEPRTPGEAVDALSEGIDIIRALWTGQEDLHIDGSVTTLAGTQGGPVPTRNMEISIGALRPVMLRLVAEKADAWVAPSAGYMLPGRAAKASLTIDSAARDIGRDPAEIRRIYNSPGHFVETAPSSWSDDDPEIVGPAEHWAQVLTHQAVDFGFSTFLLFGPAEPHRLETFIRDVAPMVRERVAVHRAAKRKCGA